MCLCSQVAVQVQVVTMLSQVAGRASSLDSTRRSRVSRVTGEAPSSTWREPHRGLHEQGDSRGIKYFLPGPEGWRFQDNAWKDAHYRPPSAERLPSPLHPLPQPTGGAVGQGPQRVAFARV